MAIKTGTFASIQYDPTGTGTGTYENILDCSYWSMQRSANILSYAACSTGGAKKKESGVKDANGQIRGYMDATNHISSYIEAGDSVFLKLYTDATNFWGGQDALGAATGNGFPAIIGTVSEEYDIDAGDLVQWQADYEADGFPKYQA